MICYSIATQEGGSHMDTLKAVQIGGFTFLVFTIGAQVWKHPGTDDSHSHKESKSGPGEPIGRNASFFAATTSTSLSSESSDFPKWDIRYE